MLKSHIFPPPLLKRLFSSPRGLTSGLCAHSNGNSTVYENRIEVLFSVYEKDLHIVNGGCTVFRRESTSIFFRIIPYAITRYPGTVSLISLTLVLKWSYIGSFMKPDRERQGEFLILLQALLWSLFPVITILIWSCLQSICLSLILGKKKKLIRDKRSL
jgi:hypothetical protein